MLGRQRKLAVLTSALWLIGWPFTSAHASPATDAGVQWLGSTQNAEGFWGNPFGGTLLRDTTAAIEALRALSPTSPNYSRAVQWLVGTNPLTVDYASRRIAALAATGNDLSAALTTLRAAQHPDGGRGLDSEHESNPFDTALALQALAALNVSDGAAAVGYLLLQQQGNGVWLDSEGEPSMQITAHAFRALWHFRHTNTQVPAALTRARDFLLSQRDAAGTWGEPFHTALVLTALIPYLPDLSSVANSISNLQSAQLANGSWVNDPYTTALALQALYLAGLPQPNPDYATIQGRVVDAQTGLPLSGVAVSLSGGASATLTTPSDGAFVFRNLGPGSYGLQLALINYATLSVSTVAGIGQSVDLGAFALAKSQGSATGTIRGTVTDAATGAPLGDVIITVSGLSSPVLTDAAGNYQIANATPGAITVSASKVGYATATGTATLAPGGIMVFSPRLLASVDPVTIASLRGKVTDGLTGQPLSGVSINVTGATTAGAVTDALGTYKISGLNAGAVNLTASLAGYDTVTASAYVTANSVNSFSPVMYPVGSTPTGANVTGVRGTVIDAVTNRALAGVTIRSTFSGITRTVSTGVDGRFEILGLVAAAGSLDISYAGYASTNYSVTLEPLLLLDVGQVRLRRTDVSEFLPDLVVTSVRTTQVRTDQQTFAVSGALVATIANQGTAGVSQVFRVLAFYDNNNNNMYDSGDTALGGAEVRGGLNAEAILDVSIPLSGALPFRDAPIAVWVDSTEVVAERNETNNMLRSGAGGVQLVFPSTGTRRYYGFNPRNDGILTLVGYGDGTTYQIRPLPSGTPITGTLNRMERREVSLGAIRQFVMEANAPLMALHSQYYRGIYNGVGTFFFPTTDGISFYGKEFFAIPISQDINAHLVVFAAEESIVTFYNANGTVAARSPTLTPGSFWLPSGLVALNTYQVTSSGKIAIEHNRANGNATVPPVPAAGCGSDDNDDVGDSYLFATFGWWQGAAAVMNVGAEPARFNLTNIATGLVAVADQSVAPGKTYFRGGLGTNYYRLDVLAGQVTVWAGDTEGGNAIAHMGDDITINRGLHGMRFVLDTQTEGAQVFAGIDATQVVVDGGAPQILNKDQFITLPPGRTVDISANKPVTMTTLGGSCCYPFNDWSKVLSMAPIAAGGNVDLTAGALRLVDNGAGQPFNLSLRVGNAGDSSSPDQVIVSFYQGNPSAGGGVLGTVTLAPIAGGAYQDVRLDNVTLTTSADLYAVVDSTNRVTECDETNNTAQIPAAAAAILGRIVVASDAASYGANAPVRLTANVTNIGALPATFTVELKIEDRNGAPVTSFPARGTGVVGSGAVSVISENWNTALTLAGSYRLRGILRDVAGALVNESVATFDIRQPGSAGPVVSLRLFTDRPVYYTTDRVNIQSLVGNATLNTIVESTQLRLSVINPAGQTVFSQNGNLSQLLPGAIMDLLLPYSFQGASVAVYRVQGQVVDLLTQAVLAQAATQYEVRFDLNKSLTGRVTVAATRLDIGTTQTCTDQLTNTGTIAAAGLEVHYAVANLDSQQLMTEQIKTVDLPAGGQSTFVQGFTTAGMPAGNYACTLRAKIDNTLKTLAFAPFTLVQPPVRINAELRPGGKGRLLVLLDSGRGEDHRPASEADPYGPPGAPGLTAQRRFLESLLKQAGWSYTITDAPEGFTRELYSGGYTVYALFAEQEKLSEEAQKVLREAVFRGEGLLVAGPHDARHYELHAALGLKLIGRVVNAIGVDLPQGTLGVSGSMTLIPGDKALRIKRLTAQSAGVYRLGAATSSGSGEDNNAPDCRDDSESYRRSATDKSSQTESEASLESATAPSLGSGLLLRSTSSIPGVVARGPRLDSLSDECEGGPQNYLDAVTLNSYGLGRSVFTGFDLLALATRDGSVSPAAQTLIKALDYVQPNPMRLYPGTVVAVDLNLENRGSAVAVQASVTLPAGVRVIDAGSAQILGSSLRWALPLAIGETRSLTFWIRLPDISGAVSLQGRVEGVVAGGAPVLAAEPVTLLTVEPAATPAGLIARIDNLLARLSGPGPALRQAREALKKAENYWPDRPEKALTEALRAAEALQGSIDPEIVALHADIAVWIRLMAQALKQG